MDELFKRLNSNGYLVDAPDGEYTITTNNWQMDNFYFSLITNAIRDAIEGVDHSDTWYFSPVIEE